MYRDAVVFAIPILILIVRPTRGCLRKTLLERGWSEWEELLKQVNAKIISMLLSYAIVRLLVSTNIINAYLRGNASYNLY